MEREGGATSSHLTVFVDNGQVWMFDLSPLTKDDPQPLSAEQLRLVAEIQSIRGELPGSADHAGVAGTLTQAPPEAA